MAKDLEKRIQELENELKDKNSELAEYRRQLSRANAAVEKMISNMDYEIKMAGLIQKLLSPTEIPHISGVEFSSKFLAGEERGGDYFDIFEHEDRLKFGILLAGSSGYTMSALFLSVLIKLSGQIEARKGMEPHKVVEGIARELLPHIQGNDTASLFYGVVDRRNFELKYCSVGHINAILQVFGEPKGGAQWLAPSAPPFSAQFNAQPLTDSIHLGPRDRLILCSEGVSEAENAERESFGRDRILEAVLKSPKTGVHELRNEILFSVEQFSKISMPRRDRTVVITEIKDKVIKLAKK